MGFLIWFIGTIGSIWFFTVFYKNEMQNRRPWQDTNDDRLAFIFICSIAVFAWPFMWIVWAFYEISKKVFPNAKE